MVLNIPKSREGMPAFLDTLNCQIGIELGVNQGDFSYCLLKDSKLKILYSVDRWAGDREHDIEQYFETTLKLHKFSDRSSVLRMTFLEAVTLFKEKYFDFIYIDGYAHVGEEETIEKWWSKLKVGGIYSGHDYCGQFPKIKSAVDNFVKKHQVKLYTTLDSGAGVNVFPSWIILKKS